MVRSTQGDVYERLGSVETRIEHIEGKMTGFDKKLDTIATAVGSSPKFDPVRILQVVAFLAGLAAAGGTAITYVASTTNAGRIAVLEFQTKEVWKAGKWVPEYPRVMREGKQAFGSDAAQ